MMSQYKNAFTGGAVIKCTILIQILSTYLGINCLIKPTQFISWIKSCGKSEKKRKHKFIRLSGVEKYPIREFQVTKGFLYSGPSTINHSREWLQRAFLIGRPGTSCII